jgi:hypothetical protein
MLHLFGGEQRGSNEDFLQLAFWNDRQVEGIPFRLVDPKVGTANNVLLLYGPYGTVPPRMPASVKVPVNGAARSIHLLGCVSGWGWPYESTDGRNWPGTPKDTVTVTVRLHYFDSRTEDHPLRNGVHFADYIRAVDVPGSNFAFMTDNGRQVRYLSLSPARDTPIRELEFIKNPADNTAPVFLAVTVEERGE